MRKHILVNDEGIPSFAGRDAVLQHAISKMGGISFQTLQKFSASDLAEHGIFLGCTVKSPPDLLEYQKATGHTPATDGDTAWIEVSVSELSLDDAKAIAIGKAAAKRWGVEVGGCYMGPVFLDTAREVRSNYVHHNQRALDDPNHVVTSWKVGPGVFTTLDADAIMAATAAVETHIQAAYDREASLVGEIIAAADMDALRAIDFDAGWPSNSPPEE